jgi:hypothetical protein
MHLNPYIFEALIHDAESAFSRLVDWINVSVGWAGKYLDCFQNSATVAFLDDEPKGNQADDAQEADDHDGGKLIVRDPCKVSNFAVRLHEVQPHRWIRSGKGLPISQATLRGSVVEACSRKEAKCSRKYSSLGISTFIRIIVTKRHGVWDPR